MTAGAPSRLPPLYDSHCHLHDRRVGDDAPAQLARAAAAGVERLLLAGVDAPGWQDALALCARFPQLRPAFGVHPQAVAADPAAAAAMVDALERRLGDGTLPRPVALGETGLDGPKDKDDEHAATLPEQEHLFRRQIRLAVAHRLPLVLHVLRAHPRALAILGEGPLPPRAGVLHSCSASAELLVGYLRLGFFVSFSGAVANPGARKLQAAARAVPLDRLLVETDAPFQTPHGRRPARNEPAFLVEIVHALAQIRGEPVDRLAEATTANARRLFDQD